MSKSNKPVITYPVTGLCGLPQIEMETTITINRSWDDERQLFVKPHQRPPVDGDLIYASGDWHVAVPPDKVRNAPLRGFRRIGRIDGGKIVDDSTTEEQVVKAFTKARFEIMMD